MGAVGAAAGDLQGAVGAGSGSHGDHGDRRARANQRAVAFTCIQWSARGALFIQPAARWPASMT
jgi:hypothetical protein